MTNDEMIAVIKAESEGKKIQYSNDSGEYWCPKNSQWDFYNLLYRVKPVDPIRTMLDVYAYKDGFDCLPSGTVPSGLRGARQWTAIDMEFIQLTPEVRATLTEKGILKC